MKRIIVLLMVVALAGCTPPTISGVPNPGGLTIPPSYLKSFPLGSKTQDDLIASLGVPDKTSEVGNKTYLAYELGQGGLRKTYTYEITNGVVTNVTYHDGGAYNGINARDYQKK
ncbi:hypothetical protein KAR10_04105 [bacterium]|nr:hypothetical protein [bacterium]